MRKVAVIGIGNSKFGVRNDVTISELAFEAVKPALEDAGVASGDIGFVAFGSVGAGAWYEELLPAVTSAEYCGLTKAGLVRCEAACASGSAAFFTAYSAVASGHTDLALAMGAEKMRQIDTPTSMEWIGRAGYYFWEFHNFGITFPAYYALYANAHMAKYGTTEERFRIFHAAFRQAADRRIAGIVACPVLPRLQTSPWHQGPSEPYSE